MKKVKEEFALLCGMNWKVTGSHSRDRPCEPPGPENLDCLDQRTFTKALQLADKVYTLEIVDAIFDGMLSYYWTNNGRYILEEHFVKWVIDNTEDGKDKVFFPPEEMKALKAALAAEEAALATEEAVWAKEKADREADRSARRAAREAKAEIAAEKMKGLVTDGRLADETIGDEIRKLVWYGFAEGDGPMEYDDRRSYYGWRDGWTQGRAQIGEWNWERGDDGENKRGDTKNVGFACTDCSGLSAEAFFKSFKKGDHFGVSVNG